jgi:uncharacterized membrane protein YeiH
LPAVNVILMGAITGAAGGLFRDVLSAEVPLLLRKGELYATASIIGAAMYLAFEAFQLPRPWSAFLGAAVVIGLRFAAIRWRLVLPTFRAPIDEDTRAD